MTRNIDPGDVLDPEVRRAHPVHDPTPIDPTIDALPAARWGIEPGAVHNVNISAPAESQGAQHQPDLEFVTQPFRTWRTLAHRRNTGASVSASRPARDEGVRGLLARCDALENVTVDEIERALGSSAAVAPDDDESIEHRSLTPWLIAIGESAHARRWGEVDRFGAGRRTGDWRDGLAVLAEEQMRVALGCSLAEDAPAHDGCSTITAAGWFRLHADLYWRLIRGDTPGARQTLGRIADHRSVVPATPGDGLTLVEALCDVIDGASSIEVALPDTPLTFADLRLALVGGEAVALAGTREAAIRWNAWFDTCWPPHVLRHPAWPVLAQRVRALLACRAGDLQSAKRWMDEAIVIADRIESPVESAIARVQAAELLVLDSQWSARERWTSLTDTGREASRGHGIPHEHHALRVRTAAVAGRFDEVSAESDATEPMAALLTGREVEVLRLFSAGHSYRQAAEVLGVGWRTVQSHAYNAYQKLGVSSKIAAVTAASRLQLL